MNDTLRLLHYYSIGNLGERLKEIEQREKRQYYNQLEKAIERTIKERQRGYE